MRAELAPWAPPDAELGFAITRKSEPPSATVLRPARWWSTVPAWAQAAAAVLVLAAGAGIANLQVRSGPDGFSVSTGWMRQAAPVARADRSSSHVGSRRAANAALVALEQQLRNEIRSTNRTEHGPHRRGVGGRGDRSGACSS